MRRAWIFSTSFVCWLWVQTMDFECALTPSGFRWRAEFSSVDNNCQKSYLRINNKINYSFMRILHELWRWMFLWLSTTLMRLLRLPLSFDISFEKHYGVLIKKIMLFSSFNQWNYIRNWNFLQAAVAPWHYLVSHSNNNNTDLSHRLCSETQWSLHSKAHYRKAINCSLWISTNATDWTRSHVSFSWSFDTHIDLLIALYWPTVPWVLPLMQWPN